MAKRKATIIVCDLCDESALDDALPAGLHLTGSVSTPGGGRPLPRDTFICWACTQRSDGLRKVTRLGLDDA